MDSPSKFLQNLISSAKKVKVSEGFLISLALLPLCLILGYLYHKSARLHELAESADQLHAKASSLQSRLKAQEMRWALVQKSPPNYLTQAIESLPLLTPELRRIQALARQYPENALIQERLAFLQGDKNRIHFVKEAERAGPFFEEREHKMHTSVQMNEDDLKKFLFAIEGEEPHPLLIIKHFELKKQKEKSDETVYNIQTELLTREVKR
jgi:hypothetical protein